MTLRISQVGPDPAATFKIDGRLMAEEVPELMRVCVGLTGQVVLDLADLQFADRQGVGALRELRAHGVKFTGASPYMELLIGNVPLDAAN